MAVHSALAMFNPKRKKSPCKYSERFTFQLLYHQVITTDAQKAAILFSRCGLATFRLLRSLVLLGNLDEFSFDKFGFKELMKKMKENKEPQPSMAVCQFQVNTQRQRTGETVAKYVGTSCKVVEFCNYEALLSQILHNHLICRITDTAAQKYLLTEKGLTLDKAVSVAQSVKKEENRAKDLQSPAEDSGELY